MSALASLRRATSGDLDALVALQHAAYAGNRVKLGVEPIPLQADYAQVLRDWEVWLADGPDGLAGALILELRPDDLLIWSVAVSPTAQKSGVGNRLLAAAEDRARQIGRPAVRLYTGQKLTHNVAWYSRHGYRVESVETMPDRAIVHMIKTDF
ncbi:GNAT family N-acetyltransferase [Alsobacter soli]|uniref:GNAT family N-acetyltransferase n=1 Tax=Alsobacter soli TaxID=2109933 RepID=UPI0018AD4846|nr:GNAT family N-acetyltransferase [Alsobacter soli]